MTVIYVTKSLFSLCIILLSNDHSQMKNMLHTILSLGVLLLIMTDAFILFYIIFSEIKFHIVNEIIETTIYGEDLS